MIVKFAEGYVKQTFDESGKCIKQEFVAGTEVQYETKGGGMILPPPDFYYPYDMAQPEE
jgi:hypothetical protein